MLETFILFRTILISEVLFVARRQSLPMIMSELYRTLENPTASAHNVELLDVTLR